MQLAPIPPTSMARVVLPTTKYVMALPSQVRSAPEDWEAIFNGLPDETFVMLDNGVSEDKTPGELDLLWKLIEAVQPDEFVLPDHLGDRKHTLLSARASHAWLNGKGYGGRLMAVPQGDSPRDYMACLYGLLEMPFVDTIGLSKYYPLFAKESRALWLQRIVRAGLHRRDVQWHLLGICEPLSEVAQQALAFPWLRGIDTCYPVLASMYGLDITKRTQIVTSPPNYFEADVYDYHSEGATDVWTALHLNLRTAYGACQGKITWKEAQ